MGRLVTRGPSSKDMDVEGGPAPPPPAPPPPTLFGVQLKCRGSVETSPRNYSSTRAEERHDVIASSKIGADADKRATLPRRASSGD